MTDSSVPPGGHRSGRGGAGKSAGRGSTGTGGAGHGATGRSATGKGGSDAGLRGGRASSGPPRGRRGPARPPSIDPAREAALDTLRAVRTDEAYANLVLPSVLRERRVTGRDAALATDLAYGTCRAQGLLDAVLGACCDRDLADLDGPVLDALRLGAFQLLRTRIPPHAAVASTVDLVRARSGSRATGFVNAVLRRVSERDESGWSTELAPDAAADPVGHLAFVHAHPRWIAEAFASALGDVGHDELAAALAADDSRPAVHLAARPGEISAEELAAITGGEESPYSPYGVLLVDGGDPGELEPVRDHLAAVQDEGSQLVALLAARAPLGPGPDERWLDACAGPGGKAALLGALAGIQGAVLDALDRAPHRARLVEKAVDGLGVRVHTGDLRDARLPEQTYDRVLVDAPCTGLGALRRRPEARWRRRPDDVTELAELQRDLLTAAYARVRPGGTVTYATCSPHRAETVDVVAEVAARTGAEILDVAALLPEVPDTQVPDGPGVQLWPHRHGTDAMYCAVLRRAPEPDPAR